MAKMGPILLGLGAAALLLRSKKGGSGTPTEGHGGFSVDPKGDTPCHILAGIWAPVPIAGQGPLAEITSIPRLQILTLTPDAFQEADAFFQAFYTEHADSPDAADLFDPTGMAYTTARHLTQDLDCPWSKQSQWTPRMKDVYTALKVFLEEGNKANLWAPFKG